MYQQTWHGPGPSWDEFWCEPASIEVVDSIGEVESWPAEVEGLFTRWQESRTFLLASDVSALVGFLWCNGIEPETIVRFGSVLLNTGFFGHNPDTLDE